MFVCVCVRACACVRVCARAYPCVCVRARAYRALSRVISGVLANLHIHGLQVAADFDGGVHRAHCARARERLVQIRFNSIFFQFQNLIISPNLTSLDQIESTRIESNAAGFPNLIESNRT